MPRLRQICATLTIAASTLFCQSAVGQNTLFGVTGDGATTSESLFTIDTNNAAITFFQGLGNGDDGEVIATIQGNQTDIFHWSGRGTENADAIYESVNTANNMITPIMYDGFHGDDLVFAEEALASTFDLVRGQFLVADLDEFLYTQTIDGTVNILGTLDHLSKGLAFKGVNLFSIERDSGQLFRISAVDGTTLAATTVTLAGETIVGANGLAINPATGELTAVLRITGGDRVLVTIDETTGVATLIGNLGDNFAGIAFLGFQFNDNAETFNHSQVAQILDGALAAGIFGDVGFLAQGLQGLDQAGQKAVFEQFAGDIFASNATIQTQNATNRNRRVADRLRSTGGGGGFFGATAAPQPQMLAASDDDFVVRGQNTRFRQTWATLYGYGGDIDSNGNASQIDYNSMGVTLGMESACCGSLVGVFADFGEGNLDTFNGAQQVDTTHQLIGGYVRRNVGPNYLIGIGSWGFDAYQGSRSLPLANVTARSKFQGDQLSLYGEAGRDMAFGSFTVQPYIAGQFVHVHQEGFSEQGAGLLNLTVGDENYDSVRSLVGVRTSASRCSRWGLVTGTLRAEWMHEYNDDANLIVGNFNVLGGPAFGVQGIDPGNDWAFLGAGLSVQGNNWTRYFVNYDAQVNSQNLTHIAWAGVEKAW